MIGTGFMQEIFFTVIKPIVCVMCLPPATVLTLTGLDFIQKLIFTNLLFFIKQSIHGFLVVNYNKT